MPSLGGGGRNLGGEKKAHVGGGAWEKNRRGIFNPRIGESIQRRDMGVEI